MARREEAIDILLELGQMFVGEDDEWHVLHAEAREQIKNARQAIEQEMEEVAVAAVLSHHAKIVGLRLCNCNGWQVNEIMIGGAGAVTVGDEARLEQHALPF